MARILVSGHGTESLIERLRESLGEDWIVLDGPVIEAAGEAGPVDAIALHERQGAAVVTALGAGEETFPHEAAAAFRRMLDERGLALGGHLPIVALAIDPERARDPAGALRRAFLAEPPIGAPRGWTKRVVTLFDSIPAPPRRPAPEPLALHADRNDAWRVTREEETTPVGVRLAPEEHVVPEETVRAGGRPLWTGMALAICVVGAVLVGMAVLSNGGSAPKAPPAAAQTR